MSTSCLQFHLEQFEGPLELLLELIRADKLEITEISLAKVADQFVEIMHNENIGAKELVDFLVVATKLLYIKSRALLINIEELEEEETSLEDHLRMYKEFADASVKINKMLEKSVFGYWGKHVPKTSPRFSPPKDISVFHLEEYFALSIGRLEPLFSIEKSVIEKKITLSQKVDQLKSILRKYKKTSFSTIQKCAQSKTEVLVSFLALLELVKRNEVKTIQASPFSDIMIHQRT